MSVLSIQQNDQMAKLWPLYLSKKLVQLVQRSNNFSEKQMLFIDKSKEYPPNIYNVDIGGYSFNVFEGRFDSYRPWFVICFSTTKINKAAENPKTINLKYHDNR